MHFEAFLSRHTKLILQAFAAFQMLTTAFWTPHQQCINNCFDPSVGLIKRWHQTWQFASNSDTDICCCFSFFFFFFFFFFWGGGGGGRGLLFWFFQFYTYMIIHSQAPRKESVIENKFPICQLKYMLWVLKELSQWDGSFEHPKHMFKSLLKHMLLTRLWILKRTVSVRTILLSTENKC